MLTTYNDYCVINMVGKFLIFISISFIILFSINLWFVTMNIYFWSIHGLQAILQGMNFTERIYESLYLKWILLADVSWIFTVLVYLISRKHYKTDIKKHYLSNKPLDDISICVIIPTFNERETIEDTINDFKRQRSVKNILVIDNHSTDGTPDIAEKLNVRVIRKTKNMGYEHSCVIGLKEALNTDSNVIVLTESDGTFSAVDVNKMIPYLENCDIVIGTRQVQVLTEKGNQNSMFYVWGNWFLAKLVQFKYFSLLHRGVIQISDVGCSYRAIRKDALEKIIGKFTTDSGEIIQDAKGGNFALFMTCVSIESDLKFIEIPITFKKRRGESKSQADNKGRGIIYGLRFLWYIIKS